jgi:MFS family permease
MTVRRRRLRSAQTLVVTHVPERRRVHSWLAWSLLVVAGTLLVTSGVISISSGTGDGFGPSMFMWALTLVFGVVGALVASRHSKNPIGWIFLGASVAASSTVLSESYAAYYVATRTGPRLLGESVAAYEQVSWVPFILAPATFLLLLVPEGRLLTSRWRWVGWCAGMGMVGTFFAQGVVAGPIPDYPQLRNPFGVNGPLLAPVQVTTLLLVAVGIVGSATSLILRFRRAQGEERLQLKWLALAGAVAGVIILVSTTAGYAVLGATAANVLIMLGVMGLPVATGFAILRYRLYDIDVVINRALVYGTLTATLAATYLGSVLLLQLILSRLTSGSSLAVAGSTLAVAALFGPARTRTQKLVDRQFFRNKYDAETTLAHFGTRIRQQVHLSDIGMDLIAVVNETVQPSHLSLWLRSSNSGR